MPDTRKLRKRKANCRAKVRYEKSKTAEHAARIRTEKIGYPIRVYKCDICGAWHLTSNQPR